MSNIYSQQLHYPLSGSFSGSFNGEFIGEFSGSFSGSGENLFKIPSSAITGLNSFQIATGSVTASVNTDPDELFLIKSGNDIYFNISSSSNTTLYSNLFIIKDFTTQQSVLTISQSIVQFATQPSIPTGITEIGSIWFTSSSLYIGLE